jgi:glutaredoxin
MQRSTWLLWILLAMCNGTVAGELYRWVDAQGKVHYGDTPARDAAKVESKKFSAVTQNENVSYETRRAQQNFPATLYVSENCGDYCAQARNLLSKRGIPFAEKKLVTEEEISTFKKQAGTDSVPVLQLGKSYITGFQAARWQNELDIAGYPKLPAYRPSGKIPAVASQVAPAIP